MNSYHDLKYHFDKLFYLIQITSNDNNNPSYNNLENVILKIIDININTYFLSQFLCIIIIIYNCCF